MPQEKKKKKKMSLDLNFTRDANINSKYIKYFNVKYKTSKVLQNT